MFGARPISPFPRQTAPRSAASESSVNKQWQERTFENISDVVASARKRRVALFGFVNYERDIVSTGRLRRGNGASWLTSSQSTADVNKTTWNPTSVLLTKDRYESAHAFFCVYCHYTLSIRPLIIKPVRINRKKCSVRNNLSETSLAHLQSRFVQLHLVHLYNIHSKNLSTILFIFYAPV